MPRPKGKTRIIIESLIDAVYLDMGENADKRQIHKEIINRAERYHRLDRKRTAKLLYDIEKSWESSS